MSDFSIGKMSLAIQGKSTIPRVAITYISDKEGARRLIEFKLVKRAVPELENSEKWHLELYHSEQLAWNCESHSLHFSGDCAIGKSSLIEYIHSSSSRTSMEELRLLRMGVRKIQKSEQNYTSFKPGQASFTTREIRTFFKFPTKLNELK